jgi:hypothetical protein
MEVRLTLPSLQFCGSFANNIWGCNSLFHFVACLRGTKKTYFAFINVIFLYLWYHSYASRYASTVYTVEDRSVAYKWTREFPNYRTLCIPRTFVRLRFDENCQSTTYKMSGWGIERWCHFRARTAKLQNIDQVIFSMQLFTKMVHFPLNVTELLVESLIWQL